MVGGERLWEVVEGGRGWEVRGERLWEVVGGERWWKVGGGGR